MKPNTMTQRDWRGLTPKQRFDIEEKQRIEQLNEIREFNNHMLYDDLATSELTWLRDRILALENRLDNLRA